MSFVKKQAVTRKKVVCFFSALLILCSFFSVTGCKSSPEKSGSKTVHIRGFISNIQIVRKPSGDYTGSILVEGEKETDTEFDKASVSVMKKTKITSIISGGQEKLEFKDLTLGDRVEVVFTGPVMESYPVQATADSITVIEHSRIVSAKNRLEGEIMSIPGVTGIGVSSKSGKPVIVVYLENDSEDLRMKILKEYEGFEVITEVTGPIEALPR